MIDTIKLNDFQTFKLTTDSSFQESLEKEMEVYLKNFTKEITVKIKEGLEIIKQKANPLLFKTLTKLFEELTTEINKTNIKFKNEMGYSLKDKQYLLAKNLNFFASNKQNKIYQNNLPKINFIFLWNKSKIIEFYFQNQAFLDKHVGLLMSLLELKYSFDKNNLEFNNFTKNIIAIIKSEPEELEEYKTFYSNILKTLVFESSYSTSIESKNELINTLRLNYTNNLMLEDLVDSLTNVITKENGKIAVKEETKSNVSLQFNDSEEKSSIVDINPIKTKVKTKGKANRSKIKTQKEKNKRKK